MPRRDTARPRPRPELQPDEILRWADTFQARFGRWPTRNDGTQGIPDSSWSAVDQCLKMGLRGLRPGSSLAKLLRDHRGRRHKGLLPSLTADRILTWADAHHARTGDWPDQYSGPVAAAPGETWGAINMALGVGGRGLPGNTSLAALLDAHRGVRNAATLTRLTVTRVLAWADAYHSRTGGWPGRDAGPVADAAGETWSGVDTALKLGRRGLPGGRSLARLLADRRGVRHSHEPPRLTTRDILTWADAHFGRTGSWPTAKSGVVAGVPGETWCAVDTALYGGLRGLPGGDSLARLLARRRGRRNPAALPPLERSRILAWADTHHARTGRWPGKGSGPVADAPGETWGGVERALRDGRRGLPGGSSLSRLLASCRRDRRAKRGIKPPRPASSRGTS